jgi:hypothetical protein
METAKVDIEKLQLLNDRINQTIEALNQVRLSVHGLQTARTSMSPISGFGLSHSGYSPHVPYGPQISQPWVSQSNPWFSATSPWSAYPQSIGLSHSAFDPYRAAQIDPIVYARLVQTFPFLAADPTGMRQFF